MKIGIDFGTCFSFLTTMVGRDIVTTLVDDASYHTGVATVIYRDGNRTVCGNGAKSLGELKPEYFVPYIKRDLKEFPDRARVGTTYTYKRTGLTGEQIVETYISYLIETAKQRANAQGVPNGSTIEEVVVTAPVGYDIHGKTEIEGVVGYRELLRRTVEKVTKLPSDKVHIIGEPEAAAMYYFYKKQLTKKETVLVFDLGGGTFDAAVVECDPNASKPYSVLATGGDTKLGGMDWDNCLKKIVYDKTKFPSVTTENGMHVPADAAQREVYENAIIEAKIRLSTHDRAFVSFNVKGEDYDEKITRDEFERASKLLLNKTIDVIKTGTLPNYERVKGIRKGDGIKNISKIILVGGASRMPQIRKKLEEEFGSVIGVDNIVSEDPHLAIACGAAVYKENNTIVRTAYTYGIKVQEAVNKYAISNILKKGEVFNGAYVEMSRSGYSPVEDYQTQINIETFISDSTDDTMPLAQGRRLTNFIVDIENGRSKKKGESSFTVGYRVTRDNVIEITVTDEQTNKIIGRHTYTGNT